MPELTREEILKGAKEAFFDAMLDGYAGGNLRKSVKTVTNGGCTKTVTFIQGDYKVVDEWHTNPSSDKSGGSTTIFFQGIPIWFMVYGGKYSKEARKFLKKSLKRTYEHRVFVGGRGRSYWEENLQYINVPHGNFESFHGEEDISDVNFGEPINLGSHQYFGLALI